MNHTIIKKFRKKPIVIEAIRLSPNPYNLNEVAKWCDADEIFYDEIRGWDAIKINTLEGVMIAHMGDWVIKGVNGEFYPCKNDIFEKTYEELHRGRG